MRRLPLVAPLTVLPILLLVLAALTGPPSGTERPGLTATGNLHTARSAHTATLLPDGRVLITGGFTRNREADPFDSAELYDPATGRFAETGPMTTGRNSHAATLLPDGTVLLTGGFDGTYMDSAERYDPSTGTFTGAGAMTRPRIAHRATALPDGRVLITGGLEGKNRQITRAEVYDPTTGRFTPAAEMNTPRNSHTQTLLRDGRVLITGGDGTGGLLASAEVYDPETGTFTPTGSMTRPRHKHAAVLLADGRVLITGGSDASDWRGRYDSAEVYDPETGTFTATGTLHEARFKHREATVLLPDGRALVAGGAATVELYDPENGVFDTVEGRLDDARFFSTVTLLQDGSALIVGGYDSRIRSTDRAWRYRP